jgi:hypothetical protein
VPQAAPGILRKARSIPLFSSQVLDFRGFSKCGEDGQDKSIPPISSFELRSIHSDRGFQILVHRTLTFINPDFLKI